LHFVKLLPGLTSLDLSGQQRTDSGLWFAAVTDAGLDSIASLRRLEELNLAGAKITDLGLAKLRALADLRELDLSRTQVTGQGLEALTGLPKLARLNLSSAPRIDQNSLPVLHSLKASVDLTDTRIAR
jgi:Leucine-rich repeat (LRR) protein